VSVDRSLKIATRKSELALWQARHVAGLLRHLYPDIEIELLPLLTQGDRILHQPLAAIGGKGLFLKELERALLSGEADLAVHSTKDLPTEMPEGVSLVGFLPRAPANDVLIIRESVKEPTLIATSSPRRRAQLKELFPTAAWKEIRGNVQTRMTKITEGFADATVMAKAGLYRLGIDSWKGVRFESISLTQSVPAAGPGAIGLQVRTGDCALYEGILCETTAKAVHLERAILAAMGGGCHTATAAHVEGLNLHIFDESFGYHLVELSADDDWKKPGFAESILEEIRS